MCQCVTVDTVSTYPPPQYRFSPSSVWKDIRPSEVHQFPLDATPGLQINSSEVSLALWTSDASHVTTITMATHNVTHVELTIAGCLDEETICRILPRRREIWTIALRTPEVLVALWNDVVILEQNLR